MTIPWQGSGRATIKAVLEAHKAEVAASEARPAEPAPEPDAELLAIRARNVAFWPTARRIVEETIADMNSGAEIDGKTERT
ncbi:MAG: hypothetical protein VW362_11010 [Candidatus Nanopelagicales bacterium]